MQLQFYDRRLWPQPCNRVEGPDLCLILLSAEGQLPISSQTVWCFSHNDLSMATPERRNSRRSCCFSRSKGNRNRPDVALPAVKKTKDGSSKLWIVTQGELWPGLSAVVMRQRSEDYIASSNTWMIVFSRQTIGMRWQKSGRQRDTSEEKIYPSHRARQHKYRSSSGENEPKNEDCQPVRGDDQPFHQVMACVGYARDLHWVSKDIHIYL